MTSSYRALEKQLGYTFKQTELLVQALTHRSAGSHNYERLEFMGDGLLNFVIAEALFHQQPEAPEGDLSRLRSTLVKEKTLAEIARQHDLGKYIVLGTGERKAGGFRRNSILSDVVEAIIGAVYLESGFQLTQALILRLYSNRLHSLPAAESLKDPKTQLQEYLQSLQQPLPRYSIIKVTGAEHQQTFSVRCELTEEEETGVVGTGSSRRKAEQDAAEKTLAFLRNRVS